MTINNEQIPSSNAAAIAEKIDDTSLPNVIIYEMPERFRLNKNGQSDSKQSGLVIIMVGFFSIVLLSSVGWYLFVYSKPKAKIVDTTGSVATTTTGVATTTKNLKGESPRDIYFKMSMEIIACRTINDITNITRQFGSKRYMSQLDMIMEPMNTANDEQKSALLSIAKVNSVPQSDVQDIQETINGNFSVLNITTNTGKKGAINLIYEDNGWKVDDEKWQDSPTMETLIATVMASSTAATSTIDMATSTASTTIPVVATTTEPQVAMVMPGIDSDNDGLTDAEESILKTDAMKTDSDADGYADGAEMTNLYNPAGKGKIFENKDLMKYLNVMYGYSTYYPSTWKLENADGESSVILRAADNQFFQIVAQANTKKQAITDWYREQFNTPVINQANIISGAGWQGVKSDNGLNVYLTSDKADNIFAISYNLDTKPTADYINMFNFLINNFSFTK